MSSSFGKVIILLLLCAAMAVSLRSQETAPAKQSASSKMSGSQKKTPPAVDGKKPSDSKKVDHSSLPADAVIVICEHPEDALDLVPKAVILRPEKYQELLDQIDKLKKQIDNPKSENTTPPTRCILRGKVGADAVRLEAEFTGTAEHADTLVSLACSQAGLSSAQTNGRISVIRRSNSGGLLVRIEKAGEYQVKLDLIVPLTGREGNSRGFELSLPRAVITQLELDLAADCTDVRVGGQLLKDLQLPGLELKNNHLGGSPGLGPVDKLDLSWKEASHSAGAPLRTVEGRIQARLDGTGLTTQADLWLSVEGEPTKVWRLLVPRNAEIKVLPSDKEVRIEHRIESDDQKYPSASLRTIQLKEARSESLHIQIKPSMMPLGRSALSIGPFFVFDAVRQTGTVVVRNQVRNIHLDYRAHVDTQPRRLETEETRGGIAATVATFVYSKVPTVEPAATVGSKSLSWLDLETAKVPAQVRMRLSHTLTLQPDDGAKGKSPDKRGDNSPAAGRGFYWQVVTTITPATKWADVDQLKIIVPPEWEPIVENVSVAPNSNPRSVTIPSSLLREAPTQSQRIEGRYKARYKAEERAILKLPRPQGTIESCELKIDSPPDVEVFLQNAEQLNLELGRQLRPNEQTWRTRGVPAEDLGIEASWRPYRPELRVGSVVDLTINGNRGDVRHELRLQLPQTPPPFVTLRVLSAAGDSLQIQDDQGQQIRWTKTDYSTTERRLPPGEVKQAVDAGRLPASTFRIPVPAKEGGKQWRLELRYSSDLTDKGRAPHTGEPFLLPLVALGEATASETKVRIWTEPGFLPRAASPRWEQQNIEEVKDRALPVLVLHCARPDAPLRLVLADQAAGFSALVERALMRVKLEEGGVQSWRAGFWLRQLADRDLDLLMPAAVQILKAQFFFNHHKVTPIIVDDNGAISGGGNIARLHLPRMDSDPESERDRGGGRQSAMLEVVFQFPPSGSGASPLHATLRPPQILRTAAVPTCWQVSVPPGRILLAPESATGLERTWSRRGWLLSASLSVPPDLRNDDEPVALVRWQDQGEQMVLTHVSQFAWLLACSLGFLVIGWGLCWSVLSQGNERGRFGRFWPMLIFVALAIAISALFWPATVCAIIYGCQPGAVVFLAVLGLLWLRHQRYRRQIVFLPSFTRGRSGSSLLRRTTSHRPPSGEPSTVDAPPPSVG
ncbi:MAG TPA: hypothetical protein VH592_17490 [Gemmataceae bacterium]